MVLIGAGISNIAPPIPLMFPSPCGDYGSYQREIGGYKYKLQPSFRPLAGIMVLINVKGIIGHMVKDMFPSPCGDYGSYLYLDN